MRQGQKSSGRRVGFGIIAVLITLGFITLPQGYAQPQNPTACSLATLNGKYAFDATGYTIINGSAQPKAVVEFLTFKGDGTLTSEATLSLNGVIVQHTSDSGLYTVSDDCTGAITFTGSGFTFDLFIAPSGAGFKMIETVSNTVLAGEARRVAAK